MCLSCRQRNCQNSMLRLQQNANEIIPYQGRGRSFYLCHECIDNEKKIKGLTKRFKQEKRQFVQFLKELVNNG